MKLIPVIHESQATDGYPPKRYTTVNGRKYEMVQEPGDEQPKPEKKHSVDENEVIICHMCGTSFMAYDTNGLRVNTYCPCCGEKLVAEE